RGVGKPPGAVPYKFMEELRLYLILPHAGPDKTEYPSKSLFGNVTGHLHQVQFLGFLYPADLLQDGIALGPLVRGILLFALLDKSVLPGLCFHGLAVMFAGVEIYGVRLGHQIEEDLVKIIEPVDGWDPRNPSGPLLGKLGPFPYGNMVIGLPYNEDLPVLSIQGIGEEQKDGLFLVRPAQVENVRGLHEGERTVGPNGIAIVGIEYRQALGLHLGHELLAIFDK